MSTRTETQVDEVLDELQRTADEIRVNVHLGGMDAKDAWRKLEPKLADAKAHAKNATDASMLALREIAKAFRDLRASL